MGKTRRWVAFLNKRTASYAQDMAAHWARRRTLRRGCYAVRVISNRASRSRQRHTVRFVGTAFTKVTKLGGSGAKRGPRSSPAEAVDAGGVVVGNEINHPDGVGLAPVAVLDESA